jgi:hypothetical protein
VNGTETDYKVAQSILKSEFVYAAGSFMGCSCGLIKYSDAEDYANREKDLRLFSEYLQGQKAQLKIFATSFDNFPDKYESVVFDSKTMLTEEFDFEEDVVLLVKK